MTPLRPGQVTDALTVPVELDGITGLVEFTDHVGIWEMAPGVDEDVEDDEIFVVLAGAGTVEFLEPELPTITLRPGSVVRLTEGMRTRWTVTETLRKIWIA
ncbi:cupin domain-containing protein [Corynebacterium variabile]|uniref:cupin domain-containing protein n=1 Tax=Corynebacterium variabile TaxID=1727 RepID=UPI001D89950A|nr:cupin domain-containing protein [Corynebacterium variabile]HJG46063.1 cupin domain-containing protein [Corynebacterium variabile]